MIRRRPHASRTRCKGSPISSIFHTSISRRRARLAALPIAAILPSLFSSACGSRVASRPIEDEARQYVRLAVALGERDLDSLDFSSGPADLAADIRRNPPPLEAIRHDA